jgi:hypothetical protein
MQIIRPRLADLHGPSAHGSAALIAVLLLLGGVTPKPARILGVLVVIALAAAIGWSGWRAAGALLPLAGLRSRTVCAFTLGVAAATCSATALGHFGQLRPGPFLIVEALVFVLSLWLPAVPRPVCTPPALLTLRSLGGIERVLLLAAVTALALRCGGSALHVLRDPGAFLVYDDLSYHLPAAAVWRQAGDLRMLKFETGDPSPTFYPFVGELCSWVALAPLADSDVLARRIQLPFALFSLLAVAALAGRLGLGRRSALFATLLYASVDHAFPALALGAGNDHATAFFTLASLDAGLALMCRPGTRTAAYTGTALGLLIGTKYIGLFFAASVLFVLVILALVKAATSRSSGHQEEPSAPRGALPGILITLAMCMILCGGYAYARNAWTSGNPVFPAPVSLFGRRLWAGWSVASLAWRRQLPEFSIDTLAFLTRRPDLFGPLFAWTMLPGALLAPALACAKRRMVLLSVLSLPIALFLEFRFLMHDHRDVRYILPAIAIAAIAAAWVLALAGPFAGALARAPALIGILIAAAERMHASSAQQAILLPLFVLSGVILSRAAGRRRTGAADGPESERPKPRRAGAAAGLLSAALLAAWAGGRSIERFQASKLASAGAARVLEEAAGGRGTRVAYAGANEPYLFFGSRLQNDVEIVPTDGDLAAQYYSWGGSIHFPFDGGSFRQWRVNLVLRGVEFVVAARTRDEGPEHAWMVADPQEFALSYRDSRTEIWRFQAAAASPARPSPPESAAAPQLRRAGGRAGSDRSPGSGRRGE